MGAKAAVRDVTRVLDLPISVGDKLAGIIPTRVGTKINDVLEIDEFKKRCLIEGLDDIALSLEKSDKIISFEKKLKSSKPWVFND